LSGPVDQAASFLSTVPSGSPKKHRGWPGPPILLHHHPLPNRTWPGRLDSPTLPVVDTGLAGVRRVTVGAGGALAGYTPASSMLIRHEMGGEGGRRLRLGYLAFGCEIHGECGGGR
jgi:hypothetical protein